MPCYCALLKRLVHARGCVPWQGHAMASSAYAVAQFIRCNPCRASPLFKSGVVHVVKAVTMRMHLQVWAALFRLVSSLLSLIASAVPVL